MAAISDIVLQLTGIAKRFGALVANDRISLTLQRGKVLAVLDENGADKSTLMPILFGDSQRFVRLPVLARECLCVD